MACVENLAQFAVQASDEELSGAAREQLRIRILDALGCAIGAVEGDPVRIVRQQSEECQGAGSCTLIGGGQSAPDRAAFYNGALMKYLGYNDAYLARGETCHPSDNLAAILAAAEYAGASGRDVMSALAASYQVQCRLSDMAPARAAGFDYTVQGAYAVAAGASRAMALDSAQAANAIAMSGAGCNGLRVSRTGRISQWSVLAYPAMASCAVLATLLAQRGVTGPLEVFEGEKGFMDAIAGVFELDWSAEDLERVKRTVVRKYCAGIHAQTAVEAVLELKRRHAFDPFAVRRVDVEIFELAYHTAGGGDEGDRTCVETREQAVQSLPYILAVALLDGSVTPAQYRPDRIASPEVRQLMARVTVRPNASYSEEFPNEMPCRVRIGFEDGRVLSRESREYLGFYTQPIAWDDAVRKFEQLAEPYTTTALRGEIAGAVMGLEKIRVSELMRLLAEVRA